jgi:NAD(P)-dependent dehydrogenase (short-subunit alcohol dehydrogenase family)
VEGFEGRHAVVTGAGAGIGQGVAVALARRGTNITIAEIDPDRGEHTATLVRQAGATALVVPTDVMQVEQVEHAVDAGHAQFGRTDFLVNNAGGVRSGLFLEQKERNWRRLIDINLVSALAATSRAVPLIAQGKQGGAVVNVVSIEASRAAPRFAVYAACKAALVNLTRTLALEFAADQIRVNAIAPDLTVTPGIRGQARGPVDPGSWPPRTDDEQDGIDRYIPLGREGAIEECGEVVAFLCSEQARYVTGVTVPVDGGTWASSGWTRTPDRSGWTLTGQAMGQSV